MSVKAQYPKTDRSQYDVFISYSHSQADLAWVKNKLLPGLEANGLSVCIDYRNFTPGEPTITEIEQAILMSRKTLLVLTPAYLKSNWTAFETLLLQTLDPANRERRVIPLLKAKCDLPTRISYLTYIDFTRPKNAELAWARLLNALELAVARETPNKPAPVPLRRLYFDHLIEIHTRLFAGRESYLREILAFIEEHLCGYIFVQALSGYGKTSLLAKLIQDNPQFAYHFISQTYKTHGSDFDPTEMDSLLVNLCEQLQMGGVKSAEQLSPRAKVYSALRTSPENGRRVIVIDAMDEVNKHPSYLFGFFPTILPPGVFVILSARKLGDRNYLPEVGLRIGDMGKVIELPGLDETAIAQLLRLAAGKTMSLAHSEEFVKRLHRISSGDPFYLRFLVEDVAQGAITFQNINSVPFGSNEYLDSQLSILDRSAHLPQQRDILGVILEAYGPIARTDLINMIEGLDRLNFHNVIRDIQRFLLVYDDMYTFCHHRFKEYFMSRTL